jgi:hypothetical protein
MPQIKRIETQNVMLTISDALHWNLRAILPTAAERTLTNGQSPVGRMNADLPRKPFLGD